MNELAAQGLIGSIRAKFTDVVGPDVCFHAVPYSKIHHNVLGTDITLRFHYPITSQVYFDIYMMSYRWAHVDSARV